MNEQQYNLPPKPDNYLAWSILATIFCCLPFGIVAIVKSSQVDSLWTTGNYDAARKAADEAQTWCIIAAVCGAVTYGGCALL